MLRSRVKNDLTECYFSKKKSYGVVNYISATKIIENKDQRGTNTVQLLNLTLTLHILIEFDIFFFL